MKRTVPVHTVVVVGLLFCGQAMRLSAEDDLQTFTSSDGHFEFRHWRPLIQCPLAPNGSTGNKAAPSCTSQGDLCGSEPTTYVCYAYPKDRFKDKLSFSGAAFFVAEVADAKSSDSCTAGSPDWQVSTTDSRTINGITFKRFVVSDAWTAHEKTGEIYRTFHEGKCYEIGIGQVLTNPTVFDPGATREFTKQDQAEVDRRLHQMLETFRLVQ